MDGGGSAPAFRSFILVLPCTEHSVHFCTRTSVLLSREQTHWLAGRYKTAVAWSQVRTVGRNVTHNNKLRSAQCWVHKANDGVRPTQQRKNLIAWIQLLQSIFNEHSWKENFVKIETAVKVLKECTDLTGYHFFSRFFASCATVLVSSRAIKFNPAHFSPIAKADRSRLPTIVQLKQRTLKFAVFT